MTDVQIAAIIVSLTAGLAYINARFIKLPSEIGLMAIALVGSFIVIALDAGGIIDAGRFEHLVVKVNFGETVLHGMLGLLLFAGALQLDLGELAEQRARVLVLSLAGTIASTLMVGGTIYLVFAAIGLPLRGIDALLFGALISPTDPIAVLSVLKRSKVPRDLAIQISGESLFNDGVGVVLFVVVFAVASGNQVGTAGVLWLFVRVAFGGALFGLVIGWIGRRMVRATGEFSVEVLITLALVLGGYATAEALGVSAPIAAVVAGLVIGSHTRNEESEHHLMLFWELVDEVLNAVLFLMLGLEATQLVVSRELAIAAAISVPVVLAARLGSVVASAAIVRPFKGPTSRHAIAILTWGGLRGGLSVALALSLPQAANRDALLTMTYVVVCFAILVQGLTLNRLLRRLGLAA